MIYVFEDYALDTQRYELRRRGVLCPLEPQGFNVLVYLVQHRDRVVSKEELFAQLWPHQTVSESTLTQRLRAARLGLAAVVDQKRNLIGVVTSEDLIARLVRA